MDRVALLPIPRWRRVIAAGFVPIRVDADRRPDINDRYNLDGWPTTALSHPSGEMLTGTTYLPAGRPQRRCSLKWPRRTPRGVTMLDDARDLRPPPPAARSSRTRPAGVEPDLVGAGVDCRPRRRASAIRTTAALAPTASSLHVAALSAAPGGIRRRRAIAALARCADAHAGRHGRRRDSRRRSTAGSSAMPPAATGRVRTPRRCWTTRSAWPSVYLDAARIFESRRAGATSRRASVIGYVRRDDSPIEPRLAFFASRAADDAVLPGADAASLRRTLEPPMVDRTTLTDLHRPGGRGLDAGGAAAAAMLRCPEAGARALDRIVTLDVSPGAGRRALVRRHGRRPRAADRSGARQPARC